MYINSIVSHLWVFWFSWISLLALEKKSTFNFEPFFLNCEVWKNRYFKRAADYNVEMYGNFGVFVAISMVSSISYYVIFFWLKRNLKTILLDQIICILDGRIKRKEKTFYRLSFACYVIIFRLFASLPWK